MLLRTQLTFGLLCLLTAGDAFAVPSFARQTGLSCNVCHSNPPELTAFGRNFKLKGYVLTDMTDKDKVGNSKDLLLSKYIPLSVMVLLSDTAFQADQPQSQNGAAGFPQQLSIFFAGGYASHFGGLAQTTYTHTDDHFSMDNTDLRYANQAKLGGHDLFYGITLNNNPSVEDLWNSTPAWGYPWISSASGVGSIASPVINGGLAQDVAGVGAYSMFAGHLYLRAPSWPHWTWLKGPTRVRVTIAPGGPSPGRETGRIPVSRPALPSAAVEDMRQADVDDVALVDEADLLHDPAGSEVVGQGEGDDLEQPELR